MKIITAILTVLCAGASAQEQQPLAADLGYQQIRCELLVARLPAGKAVGLQKELRDPKTSQQGVAKLLAMIEKNQAELVDWPSVTTMSGDRAVSENIREVRYPIEYEVAGIVVRTKNIPVPETEQVAEPKVPEPAKPAGDKKKAAEPEPEVDVHGGGPTTFETKNAGVTLEVEPRVVGDGEHIQMSVAPQHVTLMGYRREVFEAKGKYELAAEQPIFDVQKAATNVTVKSGTPELVGFFKLHEPKNTVELFIVTATIVGGKYKQPPAAPAPAPEVPVPPPGQ